MNTFSFRAECLADVLELLGSNEMKTLGRVIIAPDGRLPDVEVELNIQMTQRQLLAIIGGIEDGHVMGETLRMKDLRLNPMER